MSLREFLFGTIRAQSLFFDLGVLVLRVVAGLTMALAHGIGKIPPSDGFVGGVAAMGFPLPALFAWSAGLSEFLGGLLLAAGFLTRPSAFFLMFTMGVAGFVAHAADPFQKKEMAFLFLSIATSLLFLGGGRLSLDSLFRGKKR